MMTVLSQYTQTIIAFQLIHDVTKDVLITWSIWLNDCLLHSVTLKYFMHVQVHQYHTGMRQPQPLLHDCNAGLFRFPRTNDSRFVLTPICFVSGSCFHLCYLYLFTNTGLQHDFKIRWCSCRLAITRRVPLVETKLLTLPEHTSSALPVCIGVCVTQSLLFCVVFCGSLSFCSFSFDHPIGGDTIS
jgi:hypothetical protein